MDSVRAAVIGCGAFAKDAAFQHRRLRDVELIAAAPVARKPGGRTELPSALHHRRRRRDLADPQIDMVFLSVPHSAHFELMLAAIEAGKHVGREADDYDPRGVLPSLKAVKQAGSSRADYNRRCAPSMTYMRAGLSCPSHASVRGRGQFIEAAERPTLPEEEASMLMIRINDESSTYRPVHLD